MPTIYALSSLKIIILVSSMFFFQVEILCGQEDVVLKRIGCLGGEVAIDSVGGKVIFLKKRFLPLTDEDVEALDFGELSNVKALYAVSLIMTDRSVAQFCKLNPNLKAINIAGGGFTDKGLTGFLEKQILVEDLSLNSMSIGDETLSQVRNLKHLRCLSMRSTKISDKGLKDIGKLDRLSYLILADTGITDEGIKEIAKLPNLRLLILDRTKISDAGMKEITKLAKLRSLCIAETMITDACINDIGKLLNLRQVDIQATKITDRGRATLESMLQGVSIKFSENNRSRATER